MFLKLPSGLSEFLNGLRHADWNPFKKKPILTLDEIQKLHGYDTVIPYSDCVFSPEENIALAKRNGEKFLIDGTNGKVMHHEKHYEIEEKKHF